MRKKVAMMMVMMAVCVSGCGAKEKVRQNTEPEIVQVRDEIVTMQEELPEECFSIAVTPNTDYTYTVYGRLRSCDRLTNSDCGVAAIQPLYEGGEPYEDYPWITCYIPTEVMDKLEKLDYSSADETTAFKITLNNDTDAGGFISLPRIMVDFTEITVDEIPIWGGQ